MFLFNISYIYCIFVYKLSFSLPGHNSINFITNEVVVIGINNLGMNSKCAIFMFSTSGFNKLPS